MENKCINKNKMKAVDLLTWPTLCSSVGEERAFHSLTHLIYFIF
jgi:hypothetical protein